MDDLAGTYVIKNYDLAIRSFYFLKSSILSDMCDIDVGNCDI